MRVEPHMCHAPVHFGMLATSRIHRSTSFFRRFHGMHLSLRAAHPSLLSWYVRYADDWLLGFSGPREEAEAIKAQLRVLELSQLPGVRVDSGRWTVLGC